MKFVLHLKGIQLLPENQLDVELLEKWENKDFRSNDMAIRAGASGVRRYFQGMFIDIVE